MGNYADRTVMFFVCVLTIITVIITILNVYYFREINKDTDSSESYALAVGNFLMTLLGVAMLLGIIYLLYEMYVEKNFNEELELEKRSNDIKLQVMSSLSNSFSNTRNSIEDDANEKYTPIIQKYSEKIRKSNDRIKEMKTRVKALEQTRKIEDDVQKSKVLDQQVLDAEIKPLNQDIGMKNEQLIEKEQEILENTRQKYDGQGNVDKSAGSILEQVHEQKMKTNSLPTRRPREYFYGTIPPGSSSSFIDRIIDREK